jgi:peptidoglycan/LPS O-acetylase OafA/YrhL
MAHPERAHWLADVRRRRRWIVAVSTAVGMVTLSSAGAFWRGQPHPPPPSMSWVAFAVLGALVANVIVTRWALRRTRRPRCEVCGELVQVTPAWRATRTEACANCGRTTMAAGRP